MSERQRVLLVDDNERNLAILTKILRKEYVLETAADGSEALARAGRFEPDLVLLDIMMPGIDGYETCRRMRAMPELRRAKIIMVSARAMLSERLEGYEAGADDYVTKPFDPEELAAKVRVYLRLKTAENINDLKSSLLGMVSRETRVPLDELVDAVRALRELPPDDPAHAGYSERVEKACLRLQDVIEKVSTLGQMRTGTFDFEFETVRLRELVELAAARVHVLGFGINVLFDTAKHGDAQLWADRHWMSRTLAVVLSRAAQWCQSNDIAVEVVATEDTQNIRISGPREFATDFWLDSRSASGDCSGGKLDMAIVGAVTEAHGGNIYLESSSEDASTLVMQVPARERLAEASLV